jgi:N-acetylneuraminate synthase
MTREVTIIAEAGVNHGGELPRALEMVEVAASAGADWVKFQTFDPGALASRHAVKAAYQMRNGGHGDRQRSMLERLVLDREAHRALVERCGELGIGFLSSPFDSQSAAFLIDELELPLLKLGSGELTNAPLLWQIGHSGRSLILSTGMAELAEVRLALDVLVHARRHDRPPSGRAEFTDLFSRDGGVLGDDLVLLHCTSAYPCPPDEANLRAMDTLSAEFGLPVGYSDHTVGIEVALAAAGRGARVIEKHFTLDRGLPGPDHAASLEPSELATMVTGIRRIEQALGQGEKRATEAEKENIAAARKSLVAARAIAEGEAFDDENLAVKRPGHGRSPFEYWDVLGQRATRAHAEDEIIE